MNQKQHQNGFSMKNIIKTSHTESTKSTQQSNSQINERKIMCML